MKLNIKEIAVLSLLGAVLFCSKVITEVLPNIHILAPLIIAYTVVFRQKALYSILVFIILTGVFYGFGLWLIPYFYLWPLLWAIIMLLPKNMAKKTAVLTYMIVAGLHGFLYGTLYAPFQALAFGLNFEGTIAWIIAGLPWDAIHGVGNILVSTLTLPIITAIKKAIKQ